MENNKKNWIILRDDEPGYPLSNFVIPSHYKTDVEQVLIPYGLILDRVEKLAHDIAKDTDGPLSA
jgi:hypoxanthine phosphoribosyltransferase